MVVQERFEKTRPPSWNLIRPRKGFGGSGDCNGRYAAIRGGTMVDGGLGALARAIVMALAIALMVLLFF